MPFFDNERQRSDTKGLMVSSLLELMNTSNLGIEDEEEESNLGIEEEEEADIEQSG